MAEILPRLQEGHAPITLHQLFRDALDAYEDWGDGATEPEVVFETTPVRISQVFDALKECTDIVPVNVIGDITERLTKPWEGEGPLDEMTFSTAARVMSVLVRKRHHSTQRI